MTQRVFIRLNPLLDPQVASVTEVLADMGDIYPEAHALAAVVQAEDEGHITHVVEVLDWM